MNYYNVYKDGVHMGAVSSNDFRAFASARQKMVCTTVGKAQYIILKGEYYRVPWLRDEDAAMKGKYPTVEAYVCTEEEYNKFLSENEKLEEK